MAKRYTGVRPRGNSVQVDLVIGGQRSRFSLDIPPTPQSLKFASNLRSSAKLDIAKGVFDAAKYFPNSRSARVVNLRCPTVKASLNQFLRDSERSLSPSTYRDYKSAIDFHLIPYFGALCLDEVTSSMIKEWIGDLQISGKRINNILIPLRKVFSDAYCSEQIESNPLDRIRNLRHRASEPDPFTLDEVRQILAACSEYERALFQFAFWTGLRTSELIALDWGDIDSEYKSVFVNKAEVRGHLKGTKTFSGTRSVQLFSPSIKALELAKEIRNTKSKRVFINPRSGKPWSSDGQIRKTAWTSILKKAKVRYRRPYQTRHTYASQMLSLGVEPMWLAQQMGHRDWGMIRRVYGRWMDESRPDISLDLEAKLSQIGHKVR